MKIMTHKFVAEHINRGRKFSLCAMGVMCLGFAGDLSAAESGRLSPNDLLDRVVESAKADALWILKEDWNVIFTDGSLYQKVFPETSTFIESFKLQPKSVMLSHVRNALRTDFFNLASNVLTLSEADLNTIKDKDLREALLKVTKGAQRFGVPELLIELQKIFKKAGQDPAPLAVRNDDPVKKVIGGVALTLAAEFAKYDALTPRPKGDEKRDVFIEIIQTTKTKALVDIETHFTGTSDVEMKYKKAFCSIVVSLFDGGELMLRKDYVGMTSRWISMLSALAENASASESKGTAKDFMAKITPTLKSISILASIAASSDTAEAKATLDAIVSKPGTFRELRSEEGFHVTVNAYLGAIYGNESLQDSDIADSEYAAAFVPVGIQISRTINCPAVPTLGMLFAPIDLGNLASRRLSGDESSNDAEWADVWAPGAYLTIGITRDFPISIGGGVQWAPNLRVDSATGETHDAIHWGVFIAWDVPLFTF